MAVSIGTLSAVEQLRQQLTIMTDGQTLALTRAWVEAWDVLLPQFEAAANELALQAVTGRVSRTTVSRNVRLRGALEAAEEYLKVLSESTGDIVTRDIPEAVRAAVDAHRQIVTTQLPPGSVGSTLNFARVPEDALAAIVARTTENIHSLTKPLPADVIRLMKKHLVLGVAQGDHPSETARRMVKDAEGRFNGGLTRALTISRTETLDAHREATKASERANRDLLTEWEWHASLSSRTCPSCLSKHGQRFPLEQGGPYDHQNGRCARVSVTKSWKDLGFDIPEPPSVTPNAEEWFNNLTPATQKEIMGPERLKLLQDGSISWSDLSRKVETPGWRDSYHPTPVRDLRSL